jgi:outer membrane protein OmpA-like peptidoglycan-associated protein
MVKVRILFIIWLICIPSVFFAQKNRNREGEIAGYKTPFVRNSIGSNWFVHAGVGAQAILGDYNEKSNFSNRITLAPAVSVGKWVNPYWGVRLKGQGGALHTFGNDGAMQHNHYYNAHLDAMWNLSNYWGVYSPEKFFNFTPYAGLGYAHRFQSDDDTPSTDALSVNGGVQFGFRLCKRVNLDFDLGLAVVPDYFDRIIAHAQNDIIAAATGGLTVFLGKMSFETIVPFDPDLVSELNDKINKLRADNELLSKRPESCPESPLISPAVINEINYVPNVVFFRLNSAKVDQNQQRSVFNTAEFLKANGGKIKVVGYADKGTGSGNYNLILSEKRAKAVAKELVSKYDIPSEKIVVEWKGSEEQPYVENDWNRVVIMSAE